MVKAGLRRAVRSDPLGTVALKINRNGLCTDRFVIKDMNYEDAN